MLNVENCLRDAIMVSTYKAETDKSHNDFGTSISKSALEVCIESKRHRT